MLSNAEQYGDIWWFLSVFWMFQISESQPHPLALYDIIIASTGIV